MKMSLDKEERDKGIVLRGMEQDRLKLLTRQPFIGTVLMHLDLIPVTRGCRTAMTDGRAVYMNCKFYAALDLEERLFVLAHETWHCVLLHFVRLQTRDPERFNIAEDLEIHFILLKERMREPFVLPHDPSWAGLSAEEIYERLGHVNPKNLTPPKSSDGIQPGKDGRGFDEHLHKGQAGGGQGKQDAKGENDCGQNDREKGQTRGGQGKQDAKGEDGRRQNDGEKGQAGGGSLSCDGHGTDDATDDQSEIDTTIDESTIERLRQIVIQSAQVVERRCGSLPGYVQGIVQKLQKPELNWRELLKQFVTSCFGGSRRWLPPARRYVGMGLYLQSRREEQLSAVLAIDTSGSTMGDTPQFFAELANLLKTFGNYELTVIQCDCKIQKVENFTDDKPLPRDYRWESVGLGGTSFCPSFEYVKEKRLCPKVMIYLTDGFGPAPEKAPDFPVLWVLTHDGRKPAEWGKVIQLKGAENDNNGK